MDEIKKGIKEKKNKDTLILLLEIVKKHDISQNEWSIYTREMEKMTYFAGDIPKDRHFIFLRMNIQAGTPL